MELGRLVAQGEFASRLCAVRVSERKLESGIERLNER